MLLQTHVLVRVVPYPAEELGALERVCVDAVILTHLDRGEPGDAAADHHHLVPGGVRVGVAGRRWGTHDDAVDGKNRRVRRSLDRYDLFEALGTPSVVCARGCVPRDPTSGR